MISEVLCKELENKNLDTYQFKVKLNEEKLKMQLGKMCNRKWPYCVNDFYFENYKTVMPYLVISHQNVVPCCEEYFFEGLNEMKSKNERKVYSIYGNEDEEKDVDEFDIIIADPPYDDFDMRGIENLAKFLKKEDINIYGIVIVLI